MLKEIARATRRPLYRLITEKWPFHRSEEPELVQGSRPVFEKIAHPVQKSEETEGVGAVYSAPELALQAPARTSRRTAERKVD